MKLKTLLMGGAFLAQAMAMAHAAPVVSVEATYPRQGSTGTSHYADALRLQVAGGPALLLKPQGDDLLPITGPQFLLGDDHVLLLGWSSVGGGTETIHALLLKIAGGKPIVQRSLTLTAERSRAALLVRRGGPDTILLGIPDQGPDDDAQLNLGPARTDQLSAAQIGKLSFVAADKKANDVFYAPPTQTTPYPRRVTWLTASGTGFAPVPQAR